MAELLHPPGLPSPLEGVLNLAGSAIPVLRLDRLLPLSPITPGLYSMLIVVKGISNSRIALLVDRVSEIVSIPEREFVPVGAESSFNSCSEAAAQLRGESIHLLSPARILLEEERAALSRFQTIAQQRLSQWELDPQ